MWYCWFDLAYLPKIWVFLSPTIYLFLNEDELRPAVFNRTCSGKGLFEWRWGRGLRDLDALVMISGYVIRHWHDCAEHEVSASFTTWKYLIYYIWERVRSKRVSIHSQSKRMIRIRLLLFQCFCNWAWGHCAASQCVASVKVHTRSSVGE